MYDDPGLTIFKSWFDKVKSSVLSGVSGISSSNDLLHHVLQADAKELTETYGFLGELDLTQISRDSLASAVQDLAASEKPMEQWLTPISKINFSTLGTGSVPSILNMNRGTYNQIVEFSKEQTKSANILPPGQSGNPLSPHFDDQRLLYANWEYKQMVLDILKPNKK